MLFFPRSELIVDLRKKYLSVPEIKAIVDAQGEHRFDCIKKMRAKVAAWNTDRNNRQTKVDWQFRTRDARIKLKRL